MVFDNHFITFNFVRKKYKKKNISRNTYLYTRTLHKRFNKSGG